MIRPEAMPELSPLAMPGIQRAHPNINNFKRSPKIIEGPRAMINKHKTLIPHVVSVRPQIWLSGG